MSQYLVSGPRNNITFLQAIMTNKKFVAGDYGTSFIAQEFPNGFAGRPSDVLVDRELVAVTAAMHYNRYTYYWRQEVL